MSIISGQRLRECQGFVDKVGEIRFNKVKQRQHNKFQNLVNKKEGNITRVSNNNSIQAANNLAASRQAGAHLPSGEGSNTPPASPLLSPGEGDGPRASQAGLGLGTHLPSGEGSNSSPQATAHLHPGEGSNISQATAHLPPREAGSSSLATAHLLPGEGSISSQANTDPSPGEGKGNSQAGQLGNQVRSDKQGFRHSTRHRSPQASQENSAASQADSTNSREGTPTPTNKLPQESSNEEPNPKWVINLSSKPLALAQRSVLAKGPNFVVTPKQPPNLEYITAIEAACTKLSQQDAEELRTDINRVLRSSHLPNPT